MGNFNIVYDEIAANEGLSDCGTLSLFILCLNLIVRKRVELFVLYEIFIHKVIRIISIIMIMFIKL